MARNDCRRWSSEVICIPVDKNSIANQHPVPPGVWPDKPYWAAHDHIDWIFCARSYCWIGRNRSIRLVYAARFRRELTGITKALQSPINPLQRIVILFRNRRLARSELMAIAYAPKADASSDCDKLYATLTSVKSLKAADSLFSAYPSANNARHRL